MTVTRPKSTAIAAAVGVAAAVAAARPAAAQTTPPSASATIAPTAVDATHYQYALTLTDSAASASPVGTFWYAWVPGEDFMASSPTSITSPAGWTDTVTGGGATNGYAIQWKATSAASDVPVGGSLAGFSYVSTDSPSVEFGNSPFYPTTPILTSVAYSGAPFSDAGTTFKVSAVPEPATLSAAMMVPAWLLGRRRRRSA